MIICKTPFRISFFGGGTDYPIWYKENSGSVLSTSINKYCLINVRNIWQLFDCKYRIRYSQNEDVNDVSEIKHPSVRECIKFSNIEQGVEMIYTSDLRSMSGIGSSSAFTVGFLNALNALKSKTISKKQLAMDAIHIEQNLIKENVGSQDQTIAAFGGFNKISFEKNGDINVEPVIISPEKLKLLESHLMLFSTGIFRNASDIAAEQIKQTPAKANELFAMKAMVGEAENILASQSAPIEQFGKLLNESWKLKRSLTHLISTSRIDEIYERALKAGAIGGKLCGAGGGGFILFFAPPEDQGRIKETLKDLVQVPFRFETMGSHIIFNTPQEFF